METIITAKEASDSSSSVSRLIANFNYQIRQAIRDNKSGITLLTKQYIKLKDIIKEAGYKISYSDDDVTIISW